MAENLRWKAWSWVPPDENIAGFWFEHVASRQREDAELFAAMYRNRFDGTTDTVRVSQTRPQGEPTVLTYAEEVNP